MPTRCSADFPVCEFGRLSSRPYPTTQNICPPTATIPLRIPTGYRPKAQGCEERATLGKRHQIDFNRKAVAASAMTARNIANSTRDTRTTTYLAKTFLIFRRVNHQFAWNNSTRWNRFPTLLMGEGRGRALHHNSCRLTNLSDIWFQTLPTCHSIRRIYTTSLRALPSFPPPLASHSPPTKNITPLLK